MLKNISRLEHKVGEKIYHLVCDSDSPLADVKEALFEFSKFIGKVEDNAKAQEAQMEAEKLKAEDAKEIVIEPEVL